MQRVLAGILMLFFLGTAQGQKINWMSMNEALEAQKAQPKKIFMDAYTDWCGPCKMLDRNTFSHKDVARYINENFYPVKFNAEGTETVNYKGTEFKNPDYDPKRRGRNSQHHFAAALGVRSYPNMIFFDEKGEFIGPVSGYRAPRELEKFLRFFAEDKHKEVSSREDWEEYEANFRPTFGR